MAKGTLIVVDGIGGSGKTTVIQAMFDALIARGLNCYRMQDWKLDRPPTFDELPEMDVLFSFEPSRTWVGAAIRQELSQTEHPYGCAEVAQAFSLDRQIQYQKLILPALAAGKIIIQDRSVSSSLVYQPLMPNALTLDQVAALPGNAFAIEHAPNHLILTSLPVDTIVERIKSRTDDSKGVWQDIELLRRADQEYRSVWFRELFESHGTELHSLDTGCSLKESKTNAIALIAEILDSHAGSGDPTHNFFNS